jgi:hypothetical protein
MLFSLVNFREQHDEEISFLASRAYQKLDKTCYASLKHRLLSDLTHSHTDLIVENALLHQQLIILKRQVKQPQWSNPDRIRLVLLSHFTKFWKQTLPIIQPDPLLSWDRNGFAENC